MPLVAGFTFGSTPFLIGSLLAAQPSAASASSAASAARASAVLPDEYSADLLIRQRVTLVNDYLALAWSGPLPAAQFVIKQLRRGAAGKPMTQHAIDHFLDGVEHDRHLSQLAIVGVRIDEAGTAHLFGRSVEQGEIAGSGSRYFCEASALELFRATMKGSVEMFNDGNDLLRGICAATSIANTLLAHELDINRQIEAHAANPMLALQGGGYETVIPENGRLRKLPLFIALWRANLDDQRTQVEAPTILIKRDYAGSTLLLRWSWTTKQGRRIVLPRAQQQCLSISGADDSPVPLHAEPRKWPGFRADLECHTILVNGAAGVGGVGTLTHRCASDLDRDIRFTETPGVLSTGARLSLNGPPRIVQAVNQLRTAKG